MRNVVWPPPGIGGAACVGATRPVAAGQCSLVLRIAPSRALANSPAGFYRSAVGGGTLFASGPRTLGYVSPEDRGSTRHAGSGHISALSADVT
ncbi:unnamed protein product, partial [Iphiclides podalirius]